MAAPMPGEKSLGSEIFGPEKHPKFQEIKSYGFENVDQQVASFQVYMDLCEVRHWYNVTILPCHTLKLVYLTGQWRPSEPFEVVLPMPSQTTLSMEEIECYLQEIRPPDDGFTCKGLTLAIVEKDSTTVYYKITSGLVPPDSAEVSQKKKRKYREVFQKRKAATSWARQKYEEGYFGKDSEECDETCGQEVTGTTEEVDEVAYDEDHG